MSRKPTSPSAASRPRPRFSTEDRRAFQRSKPFEFPARNYGKNPKGFVLRAEPTGDTWKYHEISVRAFRKGKAIADILVGLDRRGNLRVLVTADGEGDGEHAVAVHPEKPRGQDNVREIYNNRHEEKHQKTILPRPQR